MRRSSNTVFHTIDHAVWVPAFAGTTDGRATRHTLTAHESAN
jgi:hypothetical protein